MSSDEDGMQIPARSSTEARRVIMDDISDDDSDDGHLPMPRTPSPTRGTGGGADGDDDDDDDIKVQRSDSDDDRARSSDGETAGAGPKILDAHERRVLSLKPEANTVELLHFPPVLEMDELVAKDRIVPDGEKYPISFRPKHRGDASAAVRAAMQRGPVGLADVLESNARLVQWSDGSHTVMVGDEHYMIIGDKLTSDYYLFRKGEDVQTVEAAVSKVGRLQPFGGSGVSAMKKSSQSVSSIGNGKGKPRKVLLTMKEGGEQEEKAAREEAERKERDRARMENKRRATMASHRRSEVRSPRYEEESEDEEEAERYAEEKERQIKRQRLNDWSFKTKKAGRRKIVGDSDDEEESDDD